LVAETAPVAELAIVRRTDYSDACPLDTQRRYQMQHRTPIFWLLLAATLAIDGFAIAWVCMTSMDRAVNLYIGLTCSQISAVCIGCCFSSTQRRLWWIGPLVAGVSVAALTTRLRQSKDPHEVYQQFLLYLSLWLSHVAILLAILWLLRQTSYAGLRGRRNGQGNWQFSLAHLLAIMTASAILLVILRLAEYMHEFWVELAAWTANNVMLAIAALIIYLSRWHAILRFGAIVGMSLILAFAITTFTYGDTDSMLVNIIQAIVLFIWLAVGEIVPTEEDSTRTVTQI
jgi:hypothetical protein